MKKRYLFFVTLEYSYSILRPLQEEIWRAGGETAWFIEPSCADLLVEGESRLVSYADVMEYNPLAIFAPGNHVYDFFPGVKVSVFHGYPLNKRVDKLDSHFKIRGWFDIYCSFGESSTPIFKSIEIKDGTFKCYETGWCKADAIVAQRATKVANPRPTIFFSATFTHGITCAPILLEKIKELAAKRNWDWIISFHPKYNETEIIEQYRALAAERDNVKYVENGVVDAEMLNRADVMLCDSSSIFLEFMMYDKRVVTFRNTIPGKHLLDVQEVSEVEAALDSALAGELPLMEDMHKFVNYHEAHLDGGNSARMLAAVDDFVENYQGELKPKRLSVVRRYKLRRQAGFSVCQAVANIMGCNNLNKIKVR